MLDQTVSAVNFRLFAILPLSGASTAEPAVADEDPDGFASQRRWPIGVGVTAAILAFLLVPAFMLIGVQVE
jgi:hypothetical protein